MSTYPTIVVTGTGVVSAMGIGKAATLQALRNLHPGISPVTFLDTVHHDLPAGEVKLSNEEMRQLLGCESEGYISRTSLLGRLALKEALAEAALGGHDIEEAHFFSGTTVGGMDGREAGYENEGHCDEQHARIAVYNCGDSTEQIADAFGRFASLATLSTACSSATNAIIAGADLLRAGEAGIVVAGGAESLSKFHLNGFNALMILDRQACRPFDRDRQGLNLGEGAAYLVMETLEHARRRGVRPICRLAGYANACDAFHQTASSPEGTGAFKSMSEALDMAGLKPADIDYINAHGTGTPNNDESESTAIMKLFGEHYPPVSSTKAFTGHTTSASGSIEAVVCMLAMKHHFVPVNLNWHTPMDNGFKPVSEPVGEMELHHILSNAFGFGGNDSTLIFSDNTESDE